MSCLLLVAATTNDENSGAAAVSELHQLRLAVPPSLQPFLEAADAPIQQNLDTWSLKLVAIMMVSSQGQMNAAADPIGDAGLQQAFPRILIFLHKFRKAPDASSSCKLVE